MKIIGYKIEEKKHWKQLVNSFELNRTSSDLSEFPLKFACNTKRVEMPQPILLGAHLNIKYQL